MKKRIISGIIAIACAVALASPLSAFAATNIKGDVNEDGTVNIDDLYKLIDELGGKSNITMSGDLNDDGAVTSIDAIILKKKVMTGVVGDVDGNGIVDSRDFDRLHKYVAEGTIKIVESNADFDKDGHVGSIDLIYLKKLVANRIKGDINGNGVVDNNDIELLKSYLSGENVEIVTENSDLNGDGALDIKDLLALSNLVNAN